MAKSRLISLATLIAITPVGMAQSDIDRMVHGWLKRLDFSARGYREKGIRSLAELAAESPSVSKLLIRTLSDPDWTKRRNAAEALGRIRPDLTGAAPELSRALADPQSEVVLAAMRSLGRLEVSTREAIPELERLIDSCTSEIQEEAVLLLGGITSRLGTDASDYYPLLRRKLDDPTLRNAALRALATSRDAYVAPMIGKELVSAVSGKNRETFANLLRDMGPAGAAGTPYLVRALRSGVVGGRVSIIRAVGAIGPAAKDAVPELCGLLGDPRFGVECALALESIGTEASEAAADLLDNLLSLQPLAIDQRYAREEASAWTPRRRAIAGLRALAAVGVKPEDAKRLLPFLAAADGVMRISAAEVVLGSGLEEGDALSVVLAGLESRESRVRRSAALAIGKIAPMAQQAIPALILELEDESEDSSHDAIAVFPLHGLVPSNTYLTRDAAAIALGSFGGLAHAAVPELTAALEDKNIRVRRAAIDALGRIRVATPASVDRLIQISRGAGTGDTRPVLIPLQRLWWETKDEEYLLEREAAIVALSRLGKGDSSALSAMSELLTDPEWSIRRASATSLGILDVEGAALQGLCACFGDGSEDVRLAAQRAITSRGRLAEPVLQGLLRDDRAMVRELAAEALKIIRHQ